MLVNSGRSRSDSEATCGEIVAIDGDIYVRDAYNTDAVDASELGAMIDRVDREWRCNDTGSGDRTVPVDRVVASVLPPGTELRAIGSGPAGSIIAAISGDEVWIYVNRSVDPFAFDAEVSEIGINSGFDGTTRFATIDDPRLVRQLLEELRSSTMASRAEDEADLDDQLLFVELVRSDGLRTVVPCWIDEDQLGDRRVGASWSTAVNDALASGPRHLVAEGIMLIGNGGTARFHPNGGCRRDRPDLEVRPGEVLAIADGGSKASYFFVSPRPPVESDDTPPDPTHLAEPRDTFVAPELVGTTIVEAGLGSDQSNDDACTVLRVAEES